MAKKRADNAGLFARLKQHHMFRIASWYATAAYVLILVANAVFPDVGLTREDVRYVIAGLALLFPVVLVLAWTFIPPTQEDPADFNRWRALRWRLGSVAAVVVLGFVSGSGIYLWRLDTRHAASAVEAGSVPVVAVLPFDRLGQVDGALTDLMQEQIEDALPRSGSVKVIPHSAFPALTGPDRLDSLAKATGADLVIQGSVQRSNPTANFMVTFEVVSITDGDTLFTYKTEYSPRAAYADMAQQTASFVDGPVNFLVGKQTWFAPGYPTTHDPRARLLFRKALASFFYGSSPGIELLRQAVAIDPNFAQAHAYLAIFMLDGSGEEAKQEAARETQRAEQLVPSLPEAKLAHAEAHIDAVDPDGALPFLEATDAPLAQNYMQAWRHAYALYQAGRWDEAIVQLKRAQSIDPFNFRPRFRLMDIAYAKRHYEEAADAAADYQSRWPLFGAVRIWKAQAQFAYVGDVGKLVAAIDGDWSMYLLSSPDSLLPLQVQLLHLQGRHAEAFRRLRDWPRARLFGTPFGTLEHRVLWADAFAVESLLLEGHTAEGRALAALNIPNAAREPDTTPDAIAVHRALLQAFAGQAAAAQQSVAPLLARLSLPYTGWTHEDVGFSDDVVVVLAWSGDKAGAIKVLSDSLKAVYGVPAAVVARDPVYRPLSREPAFVKLLAEYGVTYVEPR